MATVAQMKLDMFEPHKVKEFMKPKCEPGKVAIWFEVNAGLDNHGRWECTTVARGEISDWDLFLRELRASASDPTIHAVGLLLLYVLVGWLIWCGARRLIRS